MSLQDTLNRYQSRGSGNFAKTNWFKLADDGHTCMVRFLTKGLIGTDERGEPKYDLPIYEVHKLKIDNFDVPVQCLGDDSCPVCRAGNRPQLRIWIPLLNLEEGDRERAVQLWERGINEIKMLLSEIDENGDLSGADYKIKRMGAKNSTDTKYQFFRKQNQSMELPEMPQILGRTVKVLTAEEMTQALAGNFTLRRQDEGAGATNTGSGTTGGGGYSGSNTGSQQGQSGGGAQYGAGGGGYGRAAESVF